MLIATDFVGTMLMAEDAVGGEGGSVHFFVVYFTPDLLGVSSPNFFHPLA